MITKLFKKVLPSNLRSNIIKWRYGMSQKIKAASGSNKAATTLYYAFMSSEMKREHNAVIKGIAKKTRESNDKYLLRRNIHKLEKGLTMRPRRSIFAEGFITETYYEFKKQTPFEDEQFEWYRDVLSDYFTATGSSPVIDPLREDFNKNYNENIGLSKPFRRMDSEELKIKYDDLLSLAKRRRSIRWYLDQKVPRELVEKALQVGLLSPSACNRQPFEFRVIDDPEKVQRVAGFPMGTSGFSQQFPMVIVVVGDLSAYDSERDRHIIYIDGSLCAMSFVLALETLGLSSCIINWPDIESLERKMDKELNLPEHKRPVFLISVGYAHPDALVPFSKKKSVNEIITYN